MKRTVRAEPPSRLPAVRRSRRRRSCNCFPNWSQSKAPYQNSAAAVIWRIDVRALRQQLVVPVVCIMQVGLYTNLVKNLTGYGVHEFSEILCGHSVVDGNGQLPGCDQPGLR